MAVQKQIPKDRALDSTSGFLREGYLFISNRMKVLNTNIFSARFLGKKVIFLSGREGAQLFYKEEYFKRKGVAPMRVQKTLFGKKAIQGLDGATHKKRKSLFMSLLTPEYEEKFTNLCKVNLEKYAAAWERRDSVNLYVESKKVLFESVCQWVGIPYDMDKVSEYAEDFGCMIYGFGRIGKKYRKGKRARKRAEKWVKNCVLNVRAGSLFVDTKSPLYKISMYDEENGEKLSAQIAAVELINLIRPIIAIATFAAFEAIALLEHPECVEKLRKKDALYKEIFCQEVRRFYPFGPFVGAKAKKNITWRDYFIKKNALVILDLYGTNHDMDLWEEPNQFRPERFEERKQDLYDFIPQGGGKMNSGHRCAGDVITLKTMVVFADFLVNRIHFVMPEQDLTYSLLKIPTLPNSGVVLNHVRKVI